MLAALTPMNFKSVAAMALNVRGVSVRRAHMQITKYASTFDRIRQTKIDNVYDLIVFVHIVECKSLSSASRALNQSLAFVSKRLLRLECSLGVRLFNRTTRRLSITEEGERFYNQCKIILDEVHRAECLMAVSKDGINGMLTLTASTSMSRFHLSSVIMKFLKTYPDVKMRLIATDDVVDIIGSGVDLGVRQAELTDSSLVRRVLARDFRVICASPAYLEAHGLPQKPEDLVGHRCILSGNPPFAEWLFERGNERRIIPVNWSAVMSTADASHAAALEDGGVVYKSLWYVWEDIRAGRLVRLLPDWEAQPLKIYAIYPSARFQTPLLRTFIDFLAAEMKRREKEILTQDSHKDD
jgi:DNA-binding transcriptional LysR family regulator